MLENQHPKLLEVKNIYTYYGAIEAIKDVSIDVHQGEIVTLIGANGAGKTTLLMSICASPNARSGSILFNGENITHLPSNLIMRKGIAISPEGRRIFPKLSILENLQMGGFFLDEQSIEEGIEQAYQLFPILKQRAYQAAGTLSGGEQQMLAIGRALMTKPKLLLLDEPSLGLAPLIIAQIFEIIKTINGQGVTVLLIEQNANQALQVADRGYVIKNGHIVLHDESSRLLGDEEVKRAYLGG